jgi:hypothetical protein
MVLGGLGVSVGDTCRLLLLFPQGTDEQALRNHRCVEVFFCIEWRYVELIEREAVEL